MTQAMAPTKISGNSGMRLALSNCMDAFRRELSE
jgi:hypothetical protein